MHFWPGLLPPAPRWAALGSGCWRFPPTTLPACRCWCARSPQRRCPLFLIGDRLSPFVVGIGVLVMAGIAGIGGVGRGSHAELHEQALHGLSATPFQQRTGNARTDKLAARPHRQQIAHDGLGRVWRNVLRQHRPADVMRSAAEGARDDQRTQTADRATSDQSLGGLSDRKSVV